ncbi:hypothetical protein GCM10011594_04640 [Nakamurella endophytica]|uniref:Uncharacterized protein n=1 Tax=Nakamurella endophytica TaxID=1748367 RepID=A0A917SNK0_9ACTN|nr:hypothetical protein GCM10011594_04640 [Nakamurella endophytica]
MQQAPPAAPAGAGIGMQPMVAADPGPQAAPETVYRPLTPCRIVDTRSGGGALGAGVSRAFRVSGTTGFAPQGGKAGGCGIPSGATAIAATTVVINPAGGGYLKAYPEGAAEPNSSVLNYVKTAGAVSSGMTLSIRPLFEPALRVRNVGPAVNVAIDVQGYYIPQAQGLIGSDGTQLGGTTRIVGTSHPGTGSYYITLDRPARQCSPQVSTYNIYRYASVGLSSSTTPNTISVYLWTLDATTHRESPTDYPFFITVTC